VQLPELQVQQKSTAGSKTEVQVANRALGVNLDSKVSKASVQAHGHVGAYRKSQLSRLVQIVGTH